jgi:hypothetical protein
MRALRNISGVRLPALFAVLFFSGLRFAFGAVFNIPNGDTDALKAAITTSNGNNEDDVINLPTFGVYSLKVVDHDTGTGPTGLPMILADGGHTLTINGNGSTIERYFTATLNFRVMELGAGATAIIQNVAVSDGTLTGNQVGAGFETAAQL